MSLTLVRWSGADDADHALVCIPWAGGGAAPFRSWVECMPSNVALIAARLPGRESRLLEPPIDDISEMVEMLASEIEGMGASPVALFGHCSGALIAFEVARRLAAGGRTGVQKLFVAAQESPSVARPITAPHGADGVREALRQLGATPAAILDDDRIFELIRPAFEADARLGERYIYGEAPPLSADIHVLLGEADRGRLEIDGWGRETTGRLTVHVVEGGHMFVGKSWAEVGQLLGGLVSA